jgi:hypothetical protein
MRYVQYYDKINGKLLEVCGDRGVVILDARNSIHTSIDDAINMNGVHRPLYAAFKIFQGESFMNSNPMTELNIIHH